MSLDPPLIVTDTSLQHNCPEITMLLKETNEVYLIDIAIPGESTLSQKAVEKQTKYLDLKIEITIEYGSVKKFLLFLLSLVLWALYLRNYLYN